MADGGLGNFPSLASLGPSSLSSSESHLSFGEDDPEFVSDVDRQRFQCPVHKGLLRNTRQTTCGHRLCQECIPTWLNGEASRRCPMGEEDCEDVTETNTNPDKSIQRDMKTVLVYCKNKQEGCPLKLQLKNYKTHLDDCEFQPVPCPHSPRGCKEKVARGKLKEHQDQCPFRPVRCRLCQKEVNHNHLKNHDDNECEEKVTGCPFGCENKTLKRKEVLDHRDVCPMHPVDCKFKYMGCKFVAHKEVVEKHEKESLPQHLDLVMAHMEQLQVDTEARQQALSAERESLQQNLQASHQHRDRSSGQLRNLETQIRDLKLKLVTAMEKVITMERKVVELADRPRLEAVERSLTGVQQRMTQLERQRDTDQPQQSSSSSGGGGSVAVGGSGVGGNTQVARYGTVGAMAETVSNQLSGHEQQLQMHDIRMAEMDLRFQLLETATYDGTLIWKIKDYAQRKRDAVSNRTLSLYSQPFYSHRFGYKMCGRVYLNGDGQGKTTHLSLFFAIMRGSYDALMKWPFRQKVTLTLLDQSPERRHLSDHFVPDLNSTSFRKPVSEMNTATGCPLFVSHGVLEDQNNNFLKDDTIFIRISVDPNPYPYLF